MSKIYDRLTCCDLYDFDTDGLPDMFETAGMKLPTGEIISTKIDKPDSDDDGLLDGEEIAYTINDGYVKFKLVSNPTLADSDGDEVSDEEEYYLSTNGLSTDSDYDKLSDYLEIELWYDPLDPNPDKDHFNDYDEYINETDPYVYNMTVDESANAFVMGGLLGDWIVPDNIETLLGQIAFSFVPVVADARDYIANVFVNGDTLTALMNLGGRLLDLAPGIGVAGDAAKALPKLSRFVAKFADDAPMAIEAIVQASKHFPNADEVVPGLVKILPAGTIDNIIRSVKQGDDITEANFKRITDICEASGKNADEVIGVTKFSSFTALKKYLGDPGENKEWHHIVEQCQAKSTRSGFDVKDINTAANAKATPKEVHKEISRYYSSKQKFTNGKTVRDWLNGQDFDKQFEFGLEKWEEFMTQFGYPIK